jgi:hypothetical protein
MKRIVVIALSLGLVAAPAFAQPVKMSEAQLDGVTGGIADVTITLENSGNANVQASPSLQANPNVNVNVSVLGGGGAPGL